MIGYLGQYQGDLSISERCTAFNATTRTADETVR